MILLNNTLYILNVMVADHLLCYTNNTICMGVDKVAKKVT